MSNQNTYQSYRRSQGFRERGATRGGSGLFKWDNIRNASDRSNYLGQTEKLNTSWYEKKETSKTSNQKIDFEELKAEKRAIRNREKQLLDQCLQLGTSLPRIEEITHSLYVSDVSTVLNDRSSVDRVKGLGYEESKRKKEKKKKKKKKKKMNSKPSSSSSSSDDEEEERKKRRRERRRKRKERRKEKKDKRRKKGRKRKRIDDSLEDDLTHRKIKKRKID